jgi:hypothetical protein
VDKNDLYSYQKTKYSTPEEERDGLLKAATIANQAGWTFMEASFQLGQKAKDSGLPDETVENTIRKAYSQEKRTADRPAMAAGASSSNNADSPPPLVLDQESLDLLESRRIDPDELAIPWPSEQWRRDLVKLLQVAFAPDEVFAFRISNTPKANFERTATIINQKETINKVMRTLDGEDGALLCINPVRNNDDNDIAVFRHALVESPSMSLAKQLAFYKALNLPCAALVNSGANSVQAWVKIEADSLEEFNDRLDFLYQVLDEKGFRTDHSNKSAHRYARMPGVLREGKQQYIIGTNEGAKSWKEWKEWVEYCLDDDPLVELASYHKAPPAEKTELLEKILRQGQSLIVSAPALAGKSYNLIDLALTCCYGLDWMGIPTRKCDVLYINMELDKGTFINRMHKVAHAKHVKPDPVGIGFIHLKGMEKDPEDLARFIAKRINGARKYEEHDYKLVIIDPVHKVFGKDLINEDAYLAKLRDFIDRITHQSGASVVCASSLPESSLKGSTDSFLRLHPDESLQNTFEVSGTFKEFPSMQGHYVIWDFPLFNLR